MREYLPSYYRKSKVMNQLMDSLELEYERLKQEVRLTENQFFVLLADKNISKHEADVGIAPNPSEDLETRRGSILSKLRGTGTVTKTMMKMWRHPLSTVKLKLLNTRPSIYLQ